VEAAVLMTVCEGEEGIAWDTLHGLARSCAGARLSLQLVDDASPSAIGRRLALRFTDTTGHPADCIELPHSLGFRGTAQRLFRGLEGIAQSGRNLDMVVKLDADACIVRPDLLSFLESICPDGVGFFGERYPMRHRDTLLLLADCLPFGFARRQVGDVIHPEWRLSRLGSVWWSDFGRAALAQGYRSGFIAGGFCVLGGKTLRKMADKGWLARDQARVGFTFTDDVLLTIASCATGDPVVDLRTLSTQWGFLSTTEETPLAEIVPYRPYVVHHLKNRPRAWERRRELKAALGWPAAELNARSDVM
jgi:hypothetical protein